MDLRRGLWLGLGLVMAWLVLVGVVLVIRTGLFNVNEDLSDANVVAAIWAFIGTGIAAVVALVGSLLTSSYNARTQQLEEKAEERERHQAAVGFLSLLRKDASGHPPSPAQIAGVYVGLRGLKHNEIADGVLQVAARERELSPAILASLISDLIESDHTDEVLRAVELLRSTASSLADEDGVAWPEALRRWPRSEEDRGRDRTSGDLALPRSSRINVLVAMGSLLASKDSQYWRDHQVGWAASLLDEALVGDDDEVVRNNAYKLQQPVLVFLRGRGVTAVDRDGSRVEMRDLMEHLNAHQLTYKWSRAVRESADEITRAWASP